MHERKVEMARRSCGFIGLPGGYGTFEEIFEVTTWTQIGIHSKRTRPNFLAPLSKLTRTTAVVLANVLGYFEPVRALIKNGIKDGFIQQAGVNLIKFVDGPSDHSDHESFDWGGALLEEIDSWEWRPAFSLGYDWTKSADGEEKIEALSAT